MDAASEIFTAKDNVAEASHTSVCAISSDKNKARAICWFFNTTSQNANRFTEQVRKKFCKAYGVTCNKCQKMNHLSAACKSEQIKKRRDDRKKEIASVKEATVVAEAPAAATAALATGAAVAPAAGMNSVQSVAHSAVSLGVCF